MAYTSVVIILNIGARLILPGPPKEVIITNNLEISYLLMFLLVFGGPGQQAVIRLLSSKSSNNIKTKIYLDLLDHRLTGDSRYYISPVNL